MKLEAVGMQEGMKNNQICLALVGKQLGTTELHVRANSHVIGIAKVGSNL